MSKRVSVAETVTVQTARDLLNAALAQARTMNEAILYRAIQGVIGLKRIEAAHVKPLIGLVDGFTELTAQYGDVTKQARKEVAAKLQEDDEDGEGCEDCPENSVPSEKASGFDSRSYACSLEQLRAHLANVWTLLDSPQVAISANTPVPSVRGAAGLTGEREGGVPTPPRPSSRH